MGVQRPARVESGKQVLAVGVVAENGAPGQIVSRVRRHAQLAVLDPTALQRAVETTRQHEHGVALRHRLGHAAAVASSHRKVTGCPTCSTCGSPGTTTPTPRP